MACGLLLNDEDRACPRPEVDAFLRENSRAYVFIRCDDGEVRGWPLTAFYRTGLLFFTTYGKSAKIPHVNRAGDATVMIATPENQEPLRYCEVSGPIRVVEFTSDVVDRFMAVGPMGEGMGKSGSEPPVSDEVRRRYRDRIASGKRVLIEVDVNQARLGALEEEGTPQ